MISLIKVTIIASEFKAFFKSDCGIDRTDGYV